MSDRINKDSAEYMFGQIMAKIESMDEKSDDRHTEVVAKFEKHEQRITKLERIKHWAMGGAAAGGTGGIAAWWKHIFGGGAG